MPRVVTLAGEVPPALTTFGRVKVPGPAVPVEAQGPVSPKKALEMVVTACPFPTASSTVP